MTLTPTTDDHQTRFTPTVPVASRWWRCPTDDLMWNDTDGEECWFCHQPGTRAAAPHLTSQSGIDTDLGDLIRFRLNTQSHDGHPDAAPRRPRASHGDPSAVLR